MKSSPVFKWALTALVALYLLITVGAVVRVTGSGLGCPDWPKCWGCWIPPVKIGQVNFEKIDLEKFKRKAERLGRNPDEISLKNLREGFNPVHAWIEYINRLSSLPLSLSLLAMFMASCRTKGFKSLTTKFCLGAVILLFLNAWLGAQVVYSGLKPGIITLHMILSMLLLSLLTLIIWRTYVPKDDGFKVASLGKKSFIWGVILLVILVVEILLGSQVREITDLFIKQYGDSNRIGWIEQLEKTPAYLLHRSFSWVVVIGVIPFYFYSTKAGDLFPKLKNGILAMVVSQLLLGVIMSLFGVFGIIQVLHILLSSSLLSCVLYWVVAKANYQKSQNQRGVDI